MKVLKKATSIVLQEQENSVLKSMKLKVMVLKIFCFWSKNGLSRKKINLNKVNFYKNFSKLFSMWIRIGHAKNLSLRCTTPDPRNWKVAPSLKNNAALQSNGK